MTCNKINSFSKKFSKKGTSLFAFFISYGILSNVFQLTG